MPLFLVRGQVGRRLVASTDREHRTRCGSNDVLRDASEQEVRHAAAAVRSHDNQVDAVLPGVVGNLDEWLSFAQLVRNGRPDARGGQPVLEVSVSREATKSLVMRLLS